jgi:hypothetical protein
MAIPSHCVELEAMASAIGARSKANAKDAAIPALA